MSFNTKKTNSPNKLLMSVVLSLATLSGVTAFALFSPGPKDIIIAFLNKEFSLGVSLDTPWWVGFFPLVFCGLMVFVAWKLLWVGGEKGGEPFVAFRHHSLRVSVPPLLTSDAIPAGLGQRTLSHMDCDLTAELVGKAPSNNNIMAAIEEQTRQIERLLGSIRTLPTTKIGYYGIAHIPFQVLAGRMLGPVVSPQLYELDSKRAIWKPLLDGSGPDLHVHRTIVPAAKPLSVVAIRVSINFEVSLDDVRQVVAEPFEDIHIQLGHPSRNIITHIGQVEAICVELRTALDSLHNRMVQGGKVHLFLAVPMSVGFSVGRVISSSVNPDIICYNHTAQTSPRYLWGLHVNSDTPTSRMVIKPRLLLGDIPTNLV